MAGGNDVANVFFLSTQPMEAPGSARTREAQAFEDSQT